MSSTTAHPNGRATANEPNVADSFSGLAHDAIELAELQAQLFQLDAKIAARNGITSLGIGTVGICLLLGCVPVALVALAALFVEQLGWSHAAALGVSALIGLGLSGIAVAIAWYCIRAALDSLQRSRDELKRNIDWIKSNLKRAKSRGASVPR